MTSTPSLRTRLQPYLPRLTLEWLAEDPGRRHRVVDGSLVFADISGFTKLSEKLAKLGTMGAEEMADVITRCFTDLLAVAYDQDGGLLKFGGDALLLLFTGGTPQEHAARAARAAVGMRKRLQTVGKLVTAGGRVNLKMSVGAHTGHFDFFLVGESHRELIATGPGTTEVVRMEGTADAGEIVVSPEFAALLPAACVGEQKGPGRLLRTAPEGDPIPQVWVLPDIDDASLEGSVPTATRETLLSGVTEPEHRQVSVAFIHFDETDELLAREGPGVLADELHELVRDTQAAADEYGVCFLASDADADGGKLILTAGAPRAMGDDEERMLLALRRIIEPTRKIGVRIGVNRGNVFAGDVGPIYRRTYTVMGDTVNLAARLMAKAPPGEVYATESILERSATRFDVRELEPFLVKGKALPVHAWSVGAPLVGHAESGAPTDGYPLLGREAEMIALREVLAQVRGAHIRAVELVGDAGMGKSRLIRELCAEAEDFAFHKAIGEAYTSSWPYVAWRGILREAIGLSWDDPPDVVIERLRELVAQLDPSLLPWLPLIAVPFDVEMAPTPQVRDLAQEFVRPRLHESVGRFLRVLLQNPALFAFEDAHLMDEASADLLRALSAGEPGDRPWLFLIARRHGPQEFTSAEAPAGIRLHVGPLEGGDLITLAEAATDDHPLPAHVLEQAAERAGGNPQFLLDLVRSVSPDGELPSSVEAAATVLIDALSPADRALLRRASVLGLSFHPRFLDDLLGQDIPPPDGATWMRLDSFLEAEADGYRRFRRTMIRDAAYAGLPFRTRRQLHEVVGERYERETADPSAIAGLLSLHFFYAERHDKAWHYGRVAGDSAWNKSAVVEALDHYGRALEAVRRLSTVDAEEAAGVYRSIGEAYWRLGRFEDAVASYRQVRRLLRDNPVGVSEMLLKEAAVNDRLGRYPQALRVTTRARNVLRDVDHPEAARLRARVSVDYATTLEAQGRNEEAIRWSERAIAEAEASGDRESLPQAYLVMGYARQNLGFSDVEAHYRRALKGFEELADLSGQALMLNNLGVTAYYAGRWTQAVELWQRGADMREQLGDVVSAAYGIVNVGEVDADQGRLNEAERQFRKALRIWRAAGFGWGIAYATLNLGRTFCRKGSFDEGLELLRDARDRMRTLGATEAIEAEARMAEGLMLAGRGEEALRVVEAMCLPGVLPEEAVQMPLLERVRGYARLQLGQEEEARRSFERSLRLARDREQPFDVALTAHALAELEHRTGARVNLALEEESARILRELGVKAAPETPTRVDTSGL